MDDAGRSAATALGIGAASLVAAAVVALLRRTQGLPTGRRVGLMACLAGAAVWAVTPPRWALASVTAGLLAFAGSLVLGLAATVLVIWLYLRSGPQPTEAHEGIGDALLALYFFYIAAAVWLCVAVSVGVVVGERVATRWERGVLPNP